jgi:uncharacterized membrane protein YgaE (UPF0421/DUF939 family)
MGKYMDKKIKPGLELLDFNIALAMAICLITSRFVPIIQYIPACFAAILCAQNDARLSYKTALARIAVTIIGGLVGIGVVLLDTIFPYSWLFIFMAAAGIIVTLLICKLFRLPNMPARIGCVTLILVITVASGEKRIEYALHRVVGTVYGAVVALLTSMGSSFLAGLRPVKIQPRAGIGVFDKKNRKTAQHRKYDD